MAAVSPANASRSCLVTVGTTKFPALMRAIEDQAPAFVSALCERHRIDHLIVQTGSLRCVEQYLNMVTDPGLPNHDSLVVTSAPSLKSYVPRVPNNIWLSTSLG
jgi:hypothetical protein